MHGVSTVAVMPRGDVLLRARRRVTGWVKVGWTACMAVVISRAASSLSGRFSIGAIGSRRVDVVRSLSVVGLVVKVSVAAMSTVALTGLWRRLFLARGNRASSTAVAAGEGMDVRVAPRTSALRLCSGRP